MGWLDGKPEKRRRGERGPSRPGDDRLKRAQARAIETALKNRPELADQIAMKALGLSALEQVDPFDQFLSRLEQFRQIMPDVEATQRPPGMIDWQALGAGLASVLLGLAQSGAFGGGPAGPTEGAPAGPAAIGAGTPAPGPPADATPPAAAPVAVPVAERRRHDPIPGPAAWPSRLAHAMLVGATPSEAAVILAAQQSYDLPAVIDYLVRVPDDEVVGYLSRIAMKHDALAGLVRWAAADPAWTIEVVRELRRVRGVDSPEAAA